MTLILITLLNGLSYGLLLFLLSAGLTIIFSLMGVLNFAHAAFYMCGAYLAYSFTQLMGFGWALLGVTLCMAALGALFEATLLRGMRRRWIHSRQLSSGQGHHLELLLTFAMGELLSEAVQLIWGRAPLDFRLPQALQGSWALTPELQFPVYRLLMMALSLLLMGGLSLWWRRSRAGWLVQAAITQADMVQALGYNLPRISTAVFALGSGLAGLAGALAGPAFVTEPGMALSMGSLLFAVVVMGGMGSLKGAFWASLTIGLLQTLLISWPLPGAWSRMAPLSPYLLLVVILLLKPRGWGAT